jgi:hypothetical protein
MMNGTDANCAAEVDRRHTRVRQVMLECALTLQVTTTG